MHHESPPASHAATPTFPAEELERLHRQDRLAGSVVAGLMTIIFFFGLILYAAIAYLAAT